MKDTNQPVPGASDFRLFTRRTFLKSSALAGVAISLSRQSAAAMRLLDAPIQLGVIADLHQDIMHDGLARMQAFVDAMAQHQPDAILQLGDFAFPNAENSEVIQLFNRAHDRALHVIGNHDTDAGHTQQQCLDVWGMPGRYYTRSIKGLQIVVLDGNDKGSPTHKGGYASYVGPEQTAWLKEQLATLPGPILVVSHQPLAGEWAVDNAEEMQSILGAAAEKVILAINGHSHIDDVRRVQDVTYMHVNSASYQWVGGDFKHESYPAEVHEQHPAIAYTCPYQDALFALLTFDPVSLAIHVEGRQSVWKGPSPAKLGASLSPNLTIGEEIAPVIRNRTLERVAHIKG